MGKLQLTILTSKDLEKRYDSLKNTNMARFTNEAIARGYSIGIKLEHLQICLKLAKTNCIFHLKQKKVFRLLTVFQVVIQKVLYTTVK